MITLFGLIFTGAGVGMWLTAHPIFGSVFGFFGVLILWGAIYMWLHRTEVVVRSEAMEFRKGLLGLGQPERIQNYKFKDITIGSSMSAGNKRYYDINAVLVDDRKLKLASNLSGKRDAQMLADKFKQILNLDTNIST